MNRKKIATYLAQGLPAASIASIMGCSPGYLSQIVKEESFQLLLTEARLEIETESDEEKPLNRKYDAVEHALLNRVLEMAPVEELRNVVGALRVVAERQENMRKRINPVPLPNSPINTIHQTFIQLNIPRHALPEIHMSPIKEVTAIGNQSLAPMSATGVKNLFNALKQEEQNNSIPEIPALSDSSSSTTISEDEIF